MANANSIIHEFVRTSILVAFGLVSGIALTGQEFRGAFSGSVTDAHGAAISRAKVVATETRTGSKSETVSEDSGSFAIPFLTPGQYEITAEAPGFKKYLRRGLTLSADERPVIES